jgi:hypothetical protein
MENNFPSTYDDPEELPFNGSDSNGCIAMLVIFAVVAIVAIAWAFYELLTL